MKDLKKEFKSLEKELRQIIRSWELIPGSPADEFDALNHKLLGHLGKGSDLEKIERVIQSDLIVIYGLTVSKQLSRTFAQEVYDWWISRN